MQHKKPSALTEKDRFDYAMKHFTMVADQRMKTFHFYLISCAAAVTASFALAGKPNLPQSAFCIIGTAHLVIAIVFMIVDFRGCRMLRIASDSLQSLENEFLDGINERQVCEDVRKNKKGLWYFISYRFAFFGVFALHGAFGVLFAWKHSWILPLAHP